ncbi:ASCH domain-containing protein [uncultured Cellulomonas sp.]|uniref:ASCH domain-containing protein n=1 Tax=uncultured Cellulomonas sp. TaxID=189682 RepID=UPI002606C69F|nr:ASCH domain-containing protein [uncultured Cellulomonas sp.]
MSHDDAAPDAAPDDAPDDAPGGTPVGVPDGEEIAAFWELARGRAGLGRLAAVVGTGARASLPPPAWALGDTAEEADAQLARVLARTRTAMTTALWELADADVAPPERGDLSIVVDGRGHPRALIRTTAVRQVRFADVDAEHAAAEGEGDGSLEAWRARYAGRLAQAAAVAGRVLDDDTSVVLEQFEVRFPTRPAAAPAVREPALS